VCGGMDEHELLLGRGSRAERDEATRVAEVIEQRTEPVGPFRVTAPGIVLEHASIDDDGGTFRHAFRRYQSRFTA
jgi:hypothetical protein